MLNNQKLSVKARKKIERFLKKKRKLDSKLKQAREMADNVKVEKLENKKKILEEDVKKMIELKDGKLEKAENIEEFKPVEVQVNEKEVASPQPNPFEDIVQPQYISNRQPVQQPMSVMPGQQPIRPQLMPGQQSIRQQPMMSDYIPPQEMLQPLQVPPQSDNIAVNILLVGDINLKLPMIGTNLQPFLQEIANAIDSQASMQIDNQLINGRNIIIVQW